MPKTTPVIDIVRKKMKPPRVRGRNARTKKACPALDVFVDPSRILVLEEIPTASTSVLPIETFSPEQQTKLDDLPNEILVNIFKLLPLEDQRKARKVCRRWRSNLNTPTFFRDVKLCNAATRGLRTLNRYLRGSISAETRSVTLSCSTRGAIYVLASAASAQTLAEKCPLLEKLTFINGKLPLGVLRHLPGSVKLISFCHVYIVDERGKVLVVYRDRVEMANPMVGPDTLHNRLACRAGQRLHR